MKRWIVLPTKPVRNFAKIKQVLAALQGRETLAEIVRLVRDRDPRVGTCYSEREALRLAEAFEEAGIEWLIEEA